MYQRSSEASSLAWCKQATWSCMSCATSTTFSPKNTKLLSLLCISSAVHLVPLIEEQPLLCTQVHVFGRHDDPHEKWYTYQWSSWCCTCTDIHKLSIEMFATIIPSRKAGHSGMISISVESCWVSLMIHYLSVSNTTCLVRVAIPLLLSSSLGEFALLLLPAWSVVPTDPLSLCRHGDCILENNNTLVLIIHIQVLYHKNLV